MVETTDTSERGLERLLCTALTGHPCDPSTDGHVAEPRSASAGVGWTPGTSHGYDREFCLDRIELAAFLHATQPEAAASLALDQDGPTRRKFLARLQGEIAKRGTIDVLRHGVKHGAHNLDSVLRHAVGREPPGAGALRSESLHRRSAAPLQPRRDATRPRHRPVHQRLASFHLRAEEQPHEADGGGRGRAVQEGPQPAREAVRVRPLRRSLRGGRERGALLHAPQGQGVLLSCPSTRAGTTAPATRRIPTESRRIIFGGNY